MLRQLHLYVCQTCNHNAGDKRTLLHRATDWMEIQKVRGDVIADVCIVLFASGDNDWFAGDYTGWPQGTNKRCMSFIKSRDMKPTFVEIGDDDEDDKTSNKDKVASPSLKVPQDSPIRLRCLVIWRVAIQQNNITFVRNARRQNGNSEGSNRDPEDATGPPDHE